MAKRNGQKASYEQQLITFSAKGPTKKDAQDKLSDLIERAGYKQKKPWDFVCIVCAETSKEKKESVGSTYESVTDDLKKQFGKFNINYVSLERTYLLSKKIPKIDPTPPGIHYFNTSDVIDLKSLLS